MDGDGDLADNASGPASLTVTGKVDGATHVVRAVINSTSVLGNLLLVVAPGGNPDDALREQFAVGKGWTVTTIEANAA